MQIIQGLCRVQNELQCVVPFCVNSTAEAPIIRPSTREGPRLLGRRTSPRTSPLCIEYRKRASQPSQIQVVYNPIATKKYMRYLYIENTCEQSAIKWFVLILIVFNFDFYCTDSTAFSNSLTCKQSRYIVRSNENEVRSQ